MSFRLFLSFLFFLAACKGRVYKAGSSSMEETIMTGEPFYVKAADSFKRNDIVVFDLYGNDYSKMPDENGQFPQHWERRVFRLIALSGDTLLIRDGEVFVNGKLQPFPSAGKRMYAIYAKTALSDPELNDMGTTMMEPGADTIVYYAALSARKLEELRNRTHEVYKISRDSRPGATVPDTAFARMQSADQWDQDNYGPLRIPVPGETIQVNEANFKMFHHIPGISMGTYTIREPLYFVMGDNRHLAEDSRFIGLISHTHMRGLMK